MCDSRVATETSLCDMHLLVVMSMYLAGPDTMMCFFNTNLLKQIVVSVPCARSRRTR